MKAYTDLKQSKELVKILKLESADMFYATETSTLIAEPPYEVEGYKPCIPFIPAWSLVALLDVLPIIERKGYQKDKPRLLYNVAINKWVVDSHVYTTDAYDNQIDACFDMIEKLHELKML